MFIKFSENSRFITSCTPQESRQTSLNLFKNAKLSLKICTFSCLKYMVEEINGKKNQLFLTYVSPNCLGDVTKRVNSSSSDGFFVSLQQFKQLKANSHPFTSPNMFRSSVSNPAHKVDTVLLYFLVSESRNQHLG